MAFAPIFVLCASVLFVQTVSTQCIPPAPARSDCDAPNDIVPSNVAVGNAKGFGVLSSSAIAPKGLSVQTEYEVKGQLDAAGNLPLVAGVAVDGTVPTSGSAGTTYSCGDEVGMTEESLSAARLSAGYGGVSSNAAAINAANNVARGYAPALPSGYPASQLSRPISAAPAPWAPTPAWAPRAATWAPTSAPTWTPNAAPAWTPSTAQAWTQNAPARSPIYNTYPSAVASSSGGSFSVTSTSPIAPSGLSISSQNEISGQLDANGNLPVLSAVAIDGAYPTSGSAGTSYSCGNGEVGMSGESLSAAGVNGAGNSGRGLATANFANCGSN